MSVAFRGEIHTGPIPAAAEFAAYEEASPGAGSRILAMAENDQKDARRAEMFALRVNAGLLALQQLLAFAFAVGALYVGVRLAEGGNPVLAGTLIGTTLVSVVGLYLRKQ